MVQTISRLLSLFQTQDYECLHRPSLSGRVQRCAQLNDDPLRRLPGHGLGNRSLGPHPIQHLLVRGRRLVDMHHQGQPDLVRRLITFSKLKFAPVGFEDDLPYSIAGVDYGDYKIFGRIASDIPDEDIQMGMAMKTADNKLPNGQLNYVFTKA